MTSTDQTSTDQSRTVDAQLLRNQAAKCISEGRNEEASALFSRLAGLNGWECEGHYGLGVALYLSKRIAQAEGEWQEALKTDRCHANSLYYLGLCAKEKKDFPTAVQYIKRCLDADPEHKAAREMLLELEAPRGSTASGKLEQDKPEQNRAEVGGFYALLLRDPSDIAKQARSKIDKLTMEVDPVVSAFWGQILYRASIPLGLTVVVCLIWSIVTKGAQAVQGGMQATQQSMQAAQSQVRQAQSQQLQSIQNQIQQLNSQIQNLQAQERSGSIPSATADQISTLKNQVQSLQKEEKTASGSALQNIQGQISTLNQQIAQFTASAKSQNKSQIEASIASLNSQIQVLQAQEAQLTANVTANADVGRATTSSTAKVSSAPIGLLAVLGIIAGVGAAAFAYFKAKSTHYSIAEGRVFITSGVFSRETVNVELYKIEDVSVHQDAINLMTGDASLCLKAHGEPLTYKLRGIAKAEQMPELLHQFRDLVFVLRSGPWGKGVIA